MFDYTILSSVTCMSIFYRSVRFFMFLHCNTAMPCKHKNWISIYKEIYCPQNIDILRFRNISLKLCYGQYTFAQAWYYLRWLIDKRVQMPCLLLMSSSEFEISNASKTGFYCLRTWVRIMRSLLTDTKKWSIVFLARKI